MISIQSIVQQAIQTGYLSLHSEKQLRHLLHTTKYGAETLWAFTHLQVAVMDGRVTQQSRQQQLESPTQPQPQHCVAVDSTERHNPTNLPSIGMVNPVESSDYDSLEVTAIAEHQAQGVLLAA